jgi:prepilin-type processing-associated H-X9-DG protein
LVELLVVIGIISVLIAILLPALNKARESAKQISCMSNMKQIGMAVMMYVADNRSSFPLWMERDQVNNTWIKAFPDFPVFGTPGIRTSLHTYLKTDKVWYCPDAQPTPDNSTVPTYPQPWTWSSYAYNGSLGGTVQGSPPYAALRPPMKLTMIRDAANTVLGVETLPTLSSVYPPSNGSFEVSAEWRHNRGMNVLLCDGHVNYYKQTDQDLNASDDRMWTGTLWRIAIYGTP